MQGIDRAKKYATLAAIVVAMIIEVRSMAPAVGQTINPAPFTEAQADAGRQSYMTNCASCHGDDLSGKGAPALAGRGFANSQIGQLTVGQLYTYIQGAMPYGQGGSLTGDTYLNILAFILEANGAKPGDRPLTATAGVNVGDIIGGGAPSDSAHGAEPK